jgi:uncharacterized membrane protein
MKKVAAKSGRMEEIMKTTTNFRTAKMVQLALFTAIIALMTFTPLGYIKTLGLEITLIGIPVVIGAIVLGPAAGAILGGVFGITSFIQCFGMSSLGVLLLGIDPVRTFILCMVPRVLMGLLTGLVFQGLKKIDRTKYISYAATSLAGSLLNTIFFMSLLILFFYQTEEIQAVASTLGATSAIGFFFVAAGINAVIEAIICLIVGAAVAKTIDVYAVKSGFKYQR